MCLAHTRSHFSLQWSVSSKEDKAGPAPLIGRLKLWSQISLEEQKLFQCLSLIFSVPLHCVQQNQSKKSARIIPNNKITNNYRTSCIPYVWIFGEINRRSSWLTTNRMPLLTEALCILQQPIRTEIKAPACPTCPLFSSSHAHICFPKATDRGEMILLTLNVIHTSRTEGDIE